MPSASEGGCRSTTCGSRQQWTTKTRARSSGGRSSGSAAQVTDDVRRRRVARAPRRDAGTGSSLLTSASGVLPSRWPEGFDAHDEPWVRLEEVILDIFIGNRVQNRYRAAVLRDDDVLALG